MKLILQYQELLILEDMEEADNELINKLNENRTKKQELQGKSVEIVERLLEIRNLEANNAVFRNLTLKKIFFKLDIFLDKGNLPQCGSTQYV